MTAKRKIFTVVLSLGLCALCAAMFLPALARPSNCGGNSAALDSCRMIVISMKLAVTNETTFDLSLLEPSDREYVFRVANNHWTPTARYWLRTNNFDGTTQKQIIAVCDVVYDNVPQPTVWNFYHKNPRHAVGYADGTGGLISAAEFSQRKLAEFMDLTSLSKAAMNLPRAE